MLLIVWLPVIPVDTRLTGDFAVHHPVSIGNARKVTIVERPIRHDVVAEIRAQAENGDDEPLKTNGRLRRREHDDEAVVDVTKGIRLRGRSWWTG